jgi:hypothetical protein
LFDEADAHVLAGVSNRYVVAGTGLLVNVMIASRPVMDPAVPFKALDDIAAVGEHIVNPNQNDGMTRDNVLQLDSHNNKNRSCVFVELFVFGSILIHREI